MRIDLQNAILLVLCLLLLLSVFSLSACAAGLPVQVDVVYSNQTNFNQGFLVGNNSTRDIYVFLASDIDTYAFSVGNYIYLCSTELNSFYHGSEISAVPGTQHNISINYYVGTTNYKVSSGLNLPVQYVPSYSSVQDGVNAVDEAINSQPTPTPTSSFSYSLPPGNVAYIEMGSSSAIKLSMDFPELSNSFGTPFSKANSAYALVDSLPVVGSSVVSGTVIPWAKSGRLNLIGQTSEAAFGPIGPIATRYVAVINPSYYDHVLVTGSYMQNPPIQIEALNVLSIQVYPLQSDFFFNNDTGQVSTTIAGDAYTGDVDSETGDIYWTDPDGGSSAPALGGNNLPVAGNSIFDTLRNIASDFSEFLKGPVSAIRVVVSSIREFMGTFSQLYTWLPSPVYNLITSALMIALTIGVIKIFV